MVNAITLFTGKTSMRGRDVLAGSVSTRPHAAAARAPPR
jgi:hypothetical protein